MTSARRIVVLAALAATTAGAFVAGSPTPGFAAGASSDERAYVRTHRRPDEAAKPYCWTERKRVLVETRHGWVWRTTRVRACR